MYYLLDKTLTVLAQHENLDRPLILIQNWDSITDKKPPSFPALLQAYAFVWLHSKLHQWTDLFFIVQRCNKTKTI